MNILRLAVLRKGESVYSFSKNLLILTSMNSVRLISLEYDEDECPRIESEKSVEFNNSIKNPETKKGMFDNMKRIISVSPDVIEIQYNNGEMSIFRFEYEGVKPILTSVVTVTHGENEINMQSDDYSVSTF